MRTEPISAEELARQAREAKPHIRYARHVRGNAVAAWSSERWIPVAGLGIDGRWYSMEHELLVDGKPLFSPDEWVEVTT